MSETEFEQLLAQASRESEVHRQTYEFGHCRAEIWAPADPESVLDEETLLASHAELSWQPYWAQAWEASLGMAQHLSEQSLQDQTVLDLGCGLGITAAVALQQGASVLLADNAPPAILFSKINTWPWRERAQVQRVDWNHDQLNRRFDWILGSDILYDRADVQPLNRFFRLHLADRGRVLLSDPSRPMTREYLTRFEQLGWRLSEETVSVAGVARDVRLVTMQPTAPCVTD